MTSFYYEIRERANIVRKCDLISVLKLTGARKDRYDKNKWHTPQGIISVSGTKFMNWNKGQGGGGAIDLVIHLKNLDFKSAVSWLSDNLCSLDLQSPKEIKSKSIFKLPQKKLLKLQQVMNYLINTRYLPKSLIESLAESGLLYADNKANAVFLLLGKEKKIVGAELRGTTHLPFKGMAPGSRKDLGCFYIKNSNTKKMVLCESAIDAISYFALHPNCIAISTAGVNANPAWLTSFINKGYDIYCAFDADPPGDNCAKQMIAHHPIVKRLRPSKHDWNDLLITKIKPNISSSK